jgi:ribosome-binding ATPase
MGLSIGIVGLPNVGKSTLFNALTRAQNAAAANYPFCTIEPNQAVVPVPDDRVEKLADIVQPGETVHTTVTFVDIAGLVRGASRGEGLGNQFLAHIREADAILHVVRCFSEENVVHVEGDIDPIRDMEIVETELLLADMQTLEKRIGKLSRQARADKSLRRMNEEAALLLAHLNDGQPARTFAHRGTDLMQSFFADTQFLTDKRVIYCANVDELVSDEEEEVVERIREHAQRSDARIVRISAGTEAELVGMKDSERCEFLASYGIDESGLDQTVRVGYRTLDLVSFFTTNEKQVHAWTVRRGCRAPQAAGVVHTDFERGFIKAEVVSFDDFAAHGGEQGCRTAGVLRVEGKDYEVRDGDVILFRFHS